MLRHVLTLRQISQLTFSSSSRRYLQNKVPEKQKLFQADNDLPVHLKGGMSDTLLYRLTMSLSVLGTVYALFELFKAAMPKKK